jgi:UDP-N-acetylglucosamine 2-epimerase
MKVVSVVGVRPQFVKAAPVSRALARAGVEEVMIHTGQHYDHSMSQSFFDVLEMAPPKYELKIGSGSHGRQTGEMLAQVEEALITERPDWVLTYGDTNTTLAGALAAAKLGIAVAHVEAGLRSYNRFMPEETNRILTDHLSTLLLAPCETAVRNLEREGIRAGVHVVGDVMWEIAMQSWKKGLESSHILADLGLVSGEYILATVHRQENTTDPIRVGGIVAAFRELSRKTVVVWPVHPRMRTQMDSYSLHAIPNLRLVEPASYQDMLQLEGHAAVVLTDSGGVQKEAQWFETPCVTLREETEWVETITSGWNQLAGADTAKILAAVGSAVRPNRAPAYRKPGASHAIVHLLTCNNGQSIRNEPTRRAG